MPFSQVGDEIEEEEEIPPAPWKSGDWPGG